MKLPKATIKRIQPFIIFQIMLGINRIYLCDCKQSVNIISNIYSITLVSIIMLISLLNPIINTSHFVMNSFTTFEYSALALSAVIIMKKNFIKFFNNLQNFDKTLNIHANASFTTPISWFYCGIITISIFNFIQYYHFIIFTNLDINLFVVPLFLGDFIHDMEMLFICILFVFILKRLYILKERTIRLVGNKNINCHSKINHVRSHLKTTDLNISFLHKAYDHLYKCSRQLNFAIGFPVFVYFYFYIVIILLIM